METLKAEANDRSIGYWPAGEFPEDEPIETETADPETEEAENQADVIPLSQFVADFGNDLMQAVSRQNPPVYDGTPVPARDRVLEGLKRKPFPAQRDVVQAVIRLLVDAGEDAAIINAEMGTGKTMMAICAARASSPKPIVCAGRVAGNKCGVRSRLSSGRKASRLRVSPTTIRNPAMARPA